MNTLGPWFGYSIDASLTGWGCSCVESMAVGTGGHWTNVESQAHISVLELRAVLFALKSLLSDKRGMHARLMRDNTTAVACIVNIGTTHSAQCNSVTKDIWNLGVDRDIWVSSANVQGI